MYLINDVKAVGMRGGANSSPHPEVEQSSSREASFVVPTWLLEVAPHSTG